MSEKAYRLATKRKIYQKFGSTVLTTEESKLARVEWAKQHTPKYIEKSRFATIYLYDNAVMRMETKRYFDPEKKKLYIPTTVWQVCIKLNSEGMAEYERI